MAVTNFVVKGNVDYFKEPLAEFTISASGF
jgi:hypothetical protein